MSTADSTRSKIRRDGWTVERQLRFLDALARTRSVTQAAAFAGMSREGAYRFRGRAEDSLFAALWDRAMTAEAPRPAEVHMDRLSDRALARLLDTHFRRERGDYDAVGATSR
jgi:hypothetical protein